MNKTDSLLVLYLRYFPSFKTNALWFIIVLFFIYFLMKTAATKKKTYVNQVKKLNFY